MKIFSATLLAAAHAGKLCMFYCPMDLNEVCGSDGNTYGELNYISSLKYLLMSLPISEFRHCEYFSAESYFTKS